MTILTAFNTMAMEMGSLCSWSIEGYCSKFPEIIPTIRSIPDDYPRPPSWAKLQMIREELHRHDFVLWVDSDALVVGQQDFRDLIKDHALNIARDQNGINCGVMAWKRCDQSFAAIERMESLYEDYKDHPWFEQAALMSFVDELDVFYQPKPVWNAYPEEVLGEYTDVCQQTQVIHWPGCGDDRIKPMLRTFANLKS